MSRAALVAVTLLTCTSLLGIAWMQMTNQDENKSQQSQELQGKWMNDIIASMAWVQVASQGQNNCHTKKLEGKFGENVKCLEKVNKFSSGLSNQHFYDCSGGPKSIPQLQKCSNGTTYVTDKQKCMTKDSKKYKPIDAAALGRNFQLGSLYDIRSNMFFPESSFWDHKTIVANELQYNKMEVNTAFEADRTVMEKMSHMDISAQLSMDFLGGLIHVSGSAGYLRDAVSVDNEVNVEMIYHTTKFVKTLEKYVKKDHPEECKNKDVTHVVSSVTYGLNAVFVFKRVIHDHENQNHIAGNLSLSVAVIPGFSISGKGSVNLTEEQKEILDSTTLKMYGDFSPDKPLPSSFDEAVKFYKMLPTLTGNKENNWEGTSILQVHLTPITEYCSDADYIYNEISDSLMATVSAMLNDMENLNMKVGGLMAKRPPKRFLPLRQSLNIYKVALESYRMNKKRELQHILPNIRGGNGKGEDDLFSLVQDYNNSTFEFELSSMFLVNRSREIEAITIVLDNFPEASNILITDYESANDVECIISKKYVVILEINILTPKNLTEDFLDVNKANMDDSDFWFNKKEQIGQVGSLIRTYRNFAFDNVHNKDGCYLINLLPLIKDHPTEIKAMVYGKIIPNFEFPFAPDTPEHYNITHNSFQFKIQRTLKSVIGCKVIIVDILGNKTAIEKEINFPDDDATVGQYIEITVSNLKPAQLYSFRAKLITQVGTAPPSPTSLPFTTAPSSPPQYLVAEQVTSNSIQVQWRPPAIIGKGISMENLTYKIVIKGEEDNFYKSILTSDLSATFNGLQDATAYRIESSAGVHIQNQTNVISESVSTWISVFSSPLPPVMLAPLPAEVTQHEATVRWEPPKKLPKGSHILHYLLQYSVMDQNGTHSMAGTNHQISVNKAKCQVTNLAQGQLYAFRVKVITSDGESDFSLPSLVKTHYKQSDLDKFREKIDENLIIPRIKESEDKLELALMPIGSIIAWMGKNKLGQEIPGNWQRCDGSNITRGLLAGSRTPNLNGEGRFLRGGEENDAFSLQDDAIEDHTHLDSGHSHKDTGHYHKDKGHSHWLDSTGRNYPVLVNTPCSNPTTYIPSWFSGGWCMRWDYYTRTDYANIDKGFASISKTTSGLRGVLGAKKATETRPKNMKVVYIMRIE